MKNNDFEAAFCAAMANVGITPPLTIVPDGKEQRFASNGKKGDSAGWYKFRNGSIPTGEFGCWRLGIREFWQGDIGQPLSPEENAKFQAETEARLKAEEEEKRKNRDEAKKKAAGIIKASKLATEHPYLERKQVGSHSIYLNNNALVIPMRDEEGEVHSLQFIDTNGDKKFLSGGRIKGCYHLIGNPTDILCIAEGYATAATIHEATAFPIAVAFNAGNLTPVAKALRKQFSAARIVICADDDWRTQGNPGVIKGMEAAHEIGAVVAVPEFDESRDEKATDFNDMAASSGAEAVKEIVERIANSGVTNVTSVITRNINGLPVTAGDAAIGNDVTDVPISNRPCFKVFETATEMGKAGVWWFGYKALKDATFPKEFWICSPLYVEAVTHDAQDNNFGRLLRFRNSLGKWRLWAMPMEMLRGSGEELRGELLSMGVHLPAGDNKLLAEYLQWRMPEKIMRCALQVGWCGDSFVLPDIVIGANASEVIFQSGERGRDEHTEAGTLDEWRGLIAKPAIGNPLLIVAISAAFAGPLLHKCGAESGGIHFVGDSSTGKTTAIEAACSVWGGQNFRRSWRATSNGMEGVAALFNDCLLALDEISECDPREVGAIVYALGNGRGKQRASRTGAARNITRWRCSVLSSGERTIATTMAEGGYRIKAGQTVRLLDVPATRKFGAWDDLHGKENGATFSDAIRIAATAHHGKAGRAFLEKLTRDEQNFFERLECIKCSPEFADEKSQGQDKRVAGRFALIGMAGEVATEYGLTGWTTGDAVKAAAEGLRAWRSMRGSNSNDERRKIPEQILEYVEKHGDSRFSGINDSSSVRDRAGWWEDKGNERVYYFTSAGLREAIKGHDLKPALDLLEEIGALPRAGSSGERAWPKRLGGRQIKVYPIVPDKLVAVVTPGMTDVTPDVTPKQSDNKANASATFDTPPETSGKQRKFTREGRRSK